MEETFIIDGNSYTEVEDQLRKAYEDMLRIEKYGPDMDVQSLSDVRSPTSQKNSAVNDGLKDRPPAATGGFALVLNGHSLVSVRWSLRLSLVSVCWSLRLSLVSVCNGPSLLSVCWSLRLSLISVRWSLTDSVW